MGVAQIRGWLLRLLAALSLGRALVHAFEEAAADGAITEAELGALAVQAVHTYEGVTGRTVLVV